MMTETLVKYETAILAQQKGFPVNTTYDYYLLDGSGMMTDLHYKKFLHQDDVKDLISAPTQSLLQKWLREYHDIDLWFGMLDLPNKYHVEDIIKAGKIIAGITEGSLTYEDALEKGLYAALLTLK